MLKSTFAVNRDTPQQTFDEVGGRRLVHLDEIVIHWPEQEESRAIAVETSVDHHGTMHSRGYFEIFRFGVQIRIYLRDIQREVSIVRKPEPKPVPHREDEIDGVL